MKTESSLEGDWLKEIEARVDHLESLLTLAEKDQIVKDFRMLILEVRKLRFEVVPPAPSRLPPESRY